MATIYDVSVLAGVSLATVSRVMNNNTKVSDKTKQKVLSAMEQLGYRPNSIAQSLASNRSNSIGVLVSQLDGPYYGPMMTEIETALRTANKHVIIAAGHSVESQEKEGVEFLMSRGCDALILDVEAVDDDYLIKLCQGPTPIVLINRYIEEISDACVYLDNELGGYLATKHILSHGHKAIAYISGPKFKLDAKDRLRGHQRALTEFDLKFDEQLCFEGDFKEHSGSLAMEHLLSVNKPFTAVVCANDQMASGAIAVCLERGMKIPQDLSFVGYDNIPFPQYISPKLTTVNNPIHEMGKMAAFWVLKHVYNNTSANVENTFTPQLVVRNSATAPIK
ncbi:MULTISPECIES: LacI family DNA-binding transcriptional regulator [unclassified Shewanella]|uniref:LacI family DNA-binding transcriptional regulator n=1 Tax=unclassified Shewanella TaxID=196818 RepID=UPI000C83B685|nr:MULTISPECIES: LacI family DNA-binding transcriptional regulator [unclassified Shewanella]MDO6619589.1 LacI family DNA-binding transcriptional regulator [Shewanella sp. 6_MG-2023]MDO6641904.1 LacI family DNA-binding transcriptional regulator [Shewanella sp. 5_MG-2023]MDO6775884.1 LacI family DNA-binding transcriptional regulator [Shewanella sp. 3_MG-2023]PMG29746.1 LacI family transcriptional regulator [Shewanella sp. 10N.286.52.C2]PMH85589.1 LacI family transcriptional regulator [Shewanella